MYGRGMWGIGRRGIRIPCMKSNEMYTIQYDANYPGVLRFDVKTGERRG